MTSQNLFRGQIVTGDSNVQGPYHSQFLLHPRTFGALPINMMFKVFAPNQNFMTTPTEYLNVVSGFPPTGQLQFDPTLRFLRNGRDMASYTHVDVLHETYFLAFLLLLSLNAPLNPGNPYNGSRTEHGFGTQHRLIAPQHCRKWQRARERRMVPQVDRQPAPTSGGLRRPAAGTFYEPGSHAAGRSPFACRRPQLASSRQNFRAVWHPAAAAAFPEGAPTHPCYPTGHGTVAGACITVLKYFFDGSRPIQPLLRAAGTDVMQTSEDGLSLVPYTGADAASLTINGELSKLAFNISFWHGIHAGIHFRSSTRASILLGEQVGISVDKNQTPGYNEPFSISITKFDGTTQTFTNSTPGVFNNGKNNITTTCAA